MNITVDLTFVDAAKNKPRYIIQGIGQPAKREGDFVRHAVEITDARHKDSISHLEGHGFTLVYAQNYMPEDVSSDAVSKLAYEEIENIMKDATGADEVVIFDHTIRSSAPDQNARGAATHVHNDYTEASLLAKAEELGIDTKSGRIMELNAWQPLKEPVLVSPLAVLDGATLDIADLIKCELVYPDRVGEIYEVSYNPAQQWYYFPRMTRNDVLLFKGYDSAPEDCVSYCPHTAFTHPDETADDPVRRSVEFRAILHFKS